MLLKKKELIRRKNRKLIYKIYEDQFHQLKDAADDFITLKRQLDAKINKFRFQDHMYKILCDVKQDIQFAEDIAYIYSNIYTTNIIASMSVWGAFAAHYYTLVSNNYKMRQIISIATTMEVEELKLGK